MPEGGTNSESSCFHAGKVRHAQKKKIQLWSTCCAHSLLHGAMPASTYPHIHVPSDINVRRLNLKFEMGLEYQSRSLISSQECLLQTRSVAACGRYNKNAWTCMSSNVTGLKKTLLEPAASRAAEHSVPSFIQGP
jgi:hypothetical protein